MPQLELFDEPEERPLEAARLAPRLEKLAEQGIYLGTSSWKYPGWVGSIYSEKRYQARGKFSERKFEAECLREYAETFPVVGGDFSFYQFPTQAFWNRLFGESPDRLLFALKVPEAITVHTWPKHARYGKHAGERNPEFLDAGLLGRLFLQPLEPHSGRLAVLMFEFGTLSKSAFATPEHFLEALEGFLAVLPRGFRFGVEIRNQEYLGPRYFEALAERNIAHVFNAWTRMPGLPEQLEMAGSFTADFTAARALLKRGRPYEQAVQLFEPYREIQEPDEPTRAGLAGIAQRARHERKPAFLLVNNRLEGHAPGTIEAVIDRL